MKSGIPAIRLLVLMPLIAGLTLALGLVPMAHGDTLCVNTGGTDGCEGSIQAAVDAAVAGDTINVATGTYVEGVSVNKSVTLEASGTPVVQGGFSIAADNVTVNGFTFEGGYTFPGEPNMVAIYMVGTTGGHTISGNMLTGPGTTVGSRGILFGYYVSDVTISGNDITNWMSGIYINPSNIIVIQGNTFHENYVGIGSDGLSSVNIIDNDFIDNELEGWGASAVGANVAAHSNRFNGNNGTAVGHYGGDAINAINNWWGDASGPTHDSNPDGLGDAVIGNVLYDPWLLTPDPTPTPATWGAASIVGAEFNRTSRAANYLFLLFVPVGAVLLWRRLLRKK